ncbi:MAG: hypothetical protein IJP75_03135 [Bacteroidaceae bacterium]|nr:hypothetical protein [Bacteroidaceae bacterium]
MIKLLTKIYKRVSAETIRTLLANKYYNWYVFSQQLSNALKRQIEPHYTFVNEELPNTNQKTVVVVHNGWTESGGLADRLRGIVSVYMLCKDKGLDFRILFTHPFPLEMFLVPNQYDWRIPNNQMTYTRPAATPVCLEVGSESYWQAQKQKSFLEKQIDSANSSQIHVYTNALFAYFDHYGLSFLELFKPSERLQQAIDKELSILGVDFISVSARFMGVLGDFTDTMKTGVLPAEKKKRLIDACIQQIEALHNEHPQMKVLVNSDSFFFLEQVKQLPYTYTIPGNITHLDVTNKEVTHEDIYKTYEKTFLDFFMIAHAQSIYRLESRWMRASGFPHAASLIFGRPFHPINFSF